MVGMYIKIRNDKMLGLNLYLTDLAEIVGFWIAILLMQKPIFIRYAHSHRSFSSK